MKFLLKIAPLAVSWGAPVCALGAYTNWSALHGGPLGHAGWSVLILICCSISTATLFGLREMAQSWVVIPGIFPIAVTFAGLSVYFVPVMFVFIVGTLIGGASLEMISYDLICGLLTLLVIVGGWTGGFGLLE